MNIPHDIQKILNGMEFIVIATSDKNHNPSAVSKFILKIEKDSLYLIDFLKGITWKNVQSNPAVSLSVLDEESLLSYQLNGNVTTIRKGSEYRDLMKDFQDRQIAFSAKRVIEGVRRGRVHENFHVPKPEEVIVLKIQVEEVRKLGPAAAKQRKG